MEQAFIESCRYVTGELIVKKMLTHKDILKKLKSFLRSHADHYGIDMAFVYGSWAGGNPREDSDVDVAVWFHSDALTRDDVFGRISDLSIELSLLIKKDVNILALTGDFQNPMLQYNAIVLGIPVFVKEFDRYVSLRMEAIFQMEDFSILGRRWQLEVGERRLREGFHG